MRHIALLEFKPGLDVEFVPPTLALERTNGTLKPLACRLQTDADGFMVSDKVVHASDIKILLLGGSSIENLYIPAGQRVMDGIEAMCAASDIGAKVYNASISNAHLLHIVNLLLNKGIALRPDYIVYYATPGLDIHAAHRQNGFWHPAATLSPLRHPGRKDAVEETPARTEHSFADQRNLLKTLSALSRNFGSRLLIATWPSLGYYDEFMQRYQPDRAGFEAENAEIAVLNAVIREIAADVDCPLIDLERRFAGLPHGVYFYDENHPNAAGCALIAADSAAAILTTQKERSC